MWLDRSKTLMRLAALVVLLVVGVLASLYSLVTPLWEAPDEVGHFQYMAHLSTGRGLPLQRTGELGEAHQPPLYYIIAALAAMPADLNDPAGTYRPNPRFTWAERGGFDVNIGVHTEAEAFPFRGQVLAVHLARGISVLMGVLSVALTLAIGWEIWPERRLIGLFGAALVGLTPQFLFISGAVNNDNLRTLAATGALWQALRALKSPEQGLQWAYVGIWVAGGVLAKTDGLVVAAVPVIALSLCAIRQRSPVVLRNGASAIALVVLLLTGWWFTRNQALYGDPLGWTMYQQVFHGDFRQSPLRWNDVAEFFSVQFRSFWGLFGWMNVAPPDWYYIPPAALGILGLLGLGRFGVTRRYGALSRLQKEAVLLLGLTVVIQETFLTAIFTQCNPSCYQGRYLFTVIGPLMILASLGINSIIPRRLAAVAIGFIVLILVGVNIFALFWVIEPAYRFAWAP